jgi:hypothetical protein
MKSEARATFEEFVDPEFNAAAPPEAKPFTVWKISQFLAWEEPPDLNILGDGLLQKAGLLVTGGQGGVGKSRYALQMAICQVLALPFLGIETHGEPQRWLFIGNENSVARMKSDLTAMMSQFTPEQFAVLENHVFIQALIEMDDYFIGLGDNEVQQRWLQTLAEIKPTALVADPFGNILVGDLLKDVDVRRTIAELMRIARQVNPDIAIHILHHARTGRQNIVQAVGWDRGNFLIGSKALYSAARTVINLAPGDREDAGRIVMSCGKSNNTKPFATQGLRLNETTHFYEIDPDFDVEAWEADVSGERSGKEKNLTIQDIIDHIAAAGGKCGKREIVAAMKEEFECSAKTVQRRIAEGFKHQYFRADKSGQISLTGKAKPRKSTQPDHDEEAF